MNTGTPTEPTPRAVRRYLARFLSDPRIVPMNRLGWWFVLHLFILPKRARASAEKYRAIWTAEGSPFDVAHRKLESGLQRTFDDEGLNVMVRCAMSYGEPTVLDGVRALKDAGQEVSNHCKSPAMSISFKICANLGSMPAFRLLPRRPL